MFAKEVIDDLASTVRDSVLKDLILRCQKPIVYALEMPNYNSEKNNELRPTIDTMNILSIAIHYGLSMEHQPALLGYAQKYYDLQSRASKNFSLSGINSVNSALQEQELLDELTIQLNL